jgi:hypothetical protein
MTPLLLASVGLLGLAGPVSTVPAPTDRPVVKWEYAELTYRRDPGHPSRMTPSGTVIPAQPDTEVIRWVTADGEIEARGWDNLAERLKAPAFRPGGSAASQRLQLLNHLGGMGWELVARPEPEPGAPTRLMTFKRRVP